jgi:hypothetical protein
MSHMALGALAGLVRLALGWLLEAARVGLDAVVFRPLTWPRLADTLFQWSRTLAMAGLAASLIGGAIVSLWPPLLGHRAAGSWTAVLVRATVGTLVMATAPAAVRFLLDLNNRAVVTLTSANPPLAAWSPGILSGAPLLLLGLVAGLAILIGYLSLLYAVRAVRLFWVTALIPWFVLEWLVTGDGHRLGDVAKEVLVLIFSQTAQAMGWWLTARLLAEAKDIGGLVWAAGGLWFMAWVPSTLRQLIGLAGRG